MIREGELTQPQKGTVAAMRRARYRAHREAAEKNHHVVILVDGKVTKVWPKLEDFPLPIPDNPAFP